MTLTEFLYAFGVLFPICSVVIMPIVLTWPGRCWHGYGEQRWYGSGLRRSFHVRCERREHADYRGPHYAHHAGRMYFW